MKVKPLKCPKCDSSLQSAALDNVKMFVCTCGYSQTVEDSPDIHGVVKYIQEMSFDKLTRCYKSRNKI